MLRRGFLQLLASGVLFALIGVRGRAAPRPNRYSFDHGVASGDPLNDGVMLWTRVSGANDERLTVGWQVATDEAMISGLAPGSDALTEIVGAS